MSEIAGAARGQGRAHAVRLAQEGADISPIAPWDEITPQVFDDTMATNVTGTWNTVMAAPST